MKKIFLGLVIFALFGCSSVKDTVKTRKEQLKEYKNISVVAKTNNDTDIEIDMTSKKLKINGEVTEIIGIEVRFLNPNTNEFLLWDGKKFYKKTTSGKAKEITDPDVSNWVIFGIKIQ